MPFVARLESRLLGPPAGGAADVEGAHGELRSGLADRLGRDDPDRLAVVHHVAAREIAPVAHDADAAPRLAGEHGADLDALQAGLFDALDQVFGDLCVGGDDGVARERVLDVLERHAPEHAVAERLDDLAAFHERRHLDAVERAAVVLRDDGVLRHVHEPARQIARVGGLEGGVGQALARAVRGRDRRLDDLAGGLGHQAAHARQLADLLGAAARARVRHHEDRIEARQRDLGALFVGHRLGAEVAQHLVRDAVGHFGPDIDDFVVALAVGDQAVFVLLFDLAHVLVRLLEQDLFIGRNHHVLDGDRDAGPGGVVKTDVFQPVGEDDRRLVAGQPVAQVDQVGQLLFLHHLVHLCERDLRRRDLVEQHPADGGFDPRVPDAHGHQGLQIDRPLIEGDAHLLGIGEELARAPGARALAGHVIEAEHDVLSRHDDRLAVGRRQNVVGGHHEGARLDLRFDRERHVNRHLVAVEVRVVGGADQRMELDRLAFDQDRLEGLDAEAVQRRRPVQEDRMLADHFVEDVPDFGALLFHHFLGALDRGDVAALLELVVNEGLEELQGHLLREPALVQPELRADDDDRAAGVVHALAEQVLAEAAGLALEHVAERLERAAVLPGDRPAAPAVVEQRVDGFLQHALFVPDDHVGGVQLHQALQPVVAVDHPAVEVVQIGGGEAAAVERHERAEVRRNHRHDFHHHPLRAVARASEGVHDLEALGELFPPHFRIGVAHLLVQLFAELGDVHRHEQLADRLGPHRGGKIRAVLLHRLAVAALGQELFIFQRRGAGIEHDVGLEIKDLLDVLERHVEQRADAARQALQKPDVDDRSGELDMAHALAAHLGLDDLDAALLADHAAVAHPLVFAAVALVVLGRAENLGAKKAVALRLEGAVVDGLGLFHLAVRPRADFFRRRERDLDRVEA